MSRPARHPGRRVLLRWVGWFVAGNIGLLLLVGLRYLAVFPFAPDAAGYVYVALAYVGQMALLAGVFLGLPCLLLALLWPRRGPLSLVGVVIAAALLSLVVLDTNVFTANRFHLSLLSAMLFEWPTWTFAGVLFVILLVFQALLAGTVWRRFAVVPGGHGGRLLAAGLVAAWLGGTGLHIWGDAVGHMPITQFTRYLPLYFPIHAQGDLARLGLLDPETVQRRRQLAGGFGSGEGQLRYPLHPMQCEPPPAPPNILLILVDAMRPDAISPALTPNIAAFRDRAINFTRQYSGGNSSRMGFFSLFYGLPSTYWQTFYDLQQPPVLMDELRRAGYELSLHSAVGFGGPTLVDRTVFAGVPDLPTDSNIAGNGAVTEGWLRWLQNDYHGQRFFGFLYYDPPMAEMPTDGSEPLPGDDRFQANPEARAAWYQYRLALRRTDQEVGRVLADLQARGMADDTLVIVTSDHGYEFDDNGLGYVGHASAFSAAQLHATFLMHWPGRPAATIEYRTAHEDVPVTLLQDLLGCTNPPADYALGQNLFAGKSWDWLIAGSYTEHAIVQPHQVTISHPGGFVEVLDDHYRPLDLASVDPALVQASMEAMRRYYR